MLIPFYTLGNFAQFRDIKLITLNTLNTNRLILISTVDTFDFYRRIPSNDLLPASLTFSVSNWKNRGLKLMSFPLEIKLRNFYKNLPVSLARDKIVFKNA